MGGALAHGQFVHENCYAAQASQIQGRAKAKTEGKTEAKAGSGGGTGGDNGAGNGAGEGGGKGGDAGKGKAGPVSMKAAALNIVGEVLRLVTADNRYVRHLIKEGLTPKPPRHLAGIPPEDLMEAYQAVVKQSKFAFEQRELEGGKIQIAKQRRTATILGASVASYPGAADDANSEYVKWRDLVVAWAQKRYGKHLIGVYEHVDEANGHIHVLFANKGRNVKQLMAGPRAAQAKLAEGGTPAQAQEALIEANKRFQDEFHAEVGQHVGLGRLGPNPQPRKNYKQAKRDKGYNAALDQLAEQIEKATAAHAKIAELEEAAATQSREAHQVKEKLRAANAEKTALQLSFEAAALRQRAAHAKALAAKDEALKEKDIALAARDAELVKMHADIKEREAKAAGAVWFVKAALELNKEDKAMYDKLLTDVGERSKVLKAKALADAANPSRHHGQ